MLHTKMTCKSGDSSVNVEKILLEERDIPGAELPRPAEQCTKAMLKWLRSCRGGKVLGNQTELIKRLVFIDPISEKIYNSFNTIVIFISNENVLVVLMPQ